MRIIPREAGGITYLIKKSESFSPRQRDLIIGTLLGDGTLEKTRAGKNYCLKIQHSIKQSELVFWKYRQLQNFVLAPPKQQAVNQSLRFRTISHHELKEFQEMFYPKGKKIAPINIEEMLNPFVLSVWFMDDGNKRIEYGKLQGFHLNTQSFSVKENERLKSAIYKNFGIKCFLQGNHGKIRLYVGAESRDAFRKLIGDLVIPSLQYKLVN